MLSPLLFLFFINNLAEKLMEVDPERAQRLILSLFADEDWSMDWKLNLNASKSEVAFFSTWTHEANHIPSVSIGGTPIPFNPTPKLLGVRFDRTLSFEPHAKEVAQAASGKLGMIASVGNSKWGWDKEHLLLHARQN